MVASQAAVRETGERALEDARELQPKLNVLVGKTRELQRHVSYQKPGNYKDISCLAMGRVGAGRGGGLRRQ